MPAAAKLIPIVKIPDPVLRQIAKPVERSRWCAPASR